MFWLASVKQEFVMEMTCLVAFILILDVNGKVLPMSLNLVFSKGVMEVSLNRFRFGVVPTSLVCDSVVGYETLVCTLLVIWCFRGIGVLNRCFIGFRLVMNDPHLHVQIHLSISSMVGSLKQETCLIKKNLPPFKEM